MKKERFEWIHSWQDQNFNSDLPRILLIGDSITHGYQEIVREKFKGVAYVDYIATSYGVDATIYKQLVLNFAKYNTYDLIQFNFGLHANHLSKRSYKTRVKDIIIRLKSCAKVVLANSTVVYKQGNETIDPLWMKRVNERNQAMHEIADELNLNVNDLFTVSTTIPPKYRNEDGTHYFLEGYDALAKKVVDFLTNEL